MCLISLFHKQIDYINVTVHYGVDWLHSCEKLSGPFSKVCTEYAVVVGHLGASCQHGQVFWEPCWVQHPRLYVSVCKVVQICCLELFLEIGEIVEKTLKILFVFHDLSDHLVIKLCEEQINIFFRNPRKRFSCLCNPKWKLFNEKIFTIFFNCLLLRIYLWRSIKFFMDKNSGLKLVIASYFFCEKMCRKKVVINNWVTGIPINST